MSSFQDLLKVTQTISLCLICQWIWRNMSLKGVQKGYSIHLSPPAGTTLTQARHRIPPPLIFKTFKQNDCSIFCGNLCQGSMACFVRKSFLVAKLNPSYLSYHVLILVSLESVKYWNFKNQFNKRWVKFSNFPLVWLIFWKSPHQLF